MFSSVRMDWATPMDFSMRSTRNFTSHLILVQVLKMQSARNTIQSGQTDYYRAERAKRCFVILLTAVISRRGLSSAGRKRNNREQSS